MEVKLSPKLKKEISEVSEYGYKSEKDFIEDALRRRILELKKGEYLEKVGKVRHAMERAGLKEKDIAEDFEHSP